MAVDTNDKQMNDEPYGIITLYFDIKLLTLNEYILLERTNKFISANKKKQLTHKVKNICKSQVIGNVKFSDVYDVRIDWHRTDNRHDSDNVFFGVKFLLDGMVQENIIPNDSRKHIRNIFNFIHKSNKEHIVLTLLTHNTKFLNKSLQL